MLMQNLNSFHFAEQCAISPKRYIDLSWLPRTISFRFFILNLGAERERDERDARTVAREKIVEGAHAGGYVLRRRM